MLVGDGVLDGLAEGVDGGFGGGEVYCWDVALACGYGLRVHADRKLDEMGSVGRVLPCCIPCVRHGALDAFAEHERLVDWVGDGRVSATC